MDRIVFSGILSVIGLLASAGCGQKTGETTTANADNSAVSPAATTEAAANLGATPDKAVAEFLEAVRSGNDEAAAAMLTPLAQQKTAEEGLAVAPPGRPTAKFTVGKFEYVTPNKDGAHVISNWSDVDEEGKTRNDEIIWVLRKEANGWRIVGSVMKIFPDREPLVLNYEDPADMRRKLEMVSQEEVNAGGQQPGVQSAQPQAQAPGTGNPIVR